MAQLILEPPDQALELLRSAAVARFRALRSSHPFADILGSRSRAARLQRGSSQSCFLKVFAGIPSDYLTVCYAK